MNSTETTTLTVGRKDCGMGVQMERVTVGDETFLFHAKSGRYFRQCSKCIDACGTIGAFMHHAAGVCFDCDGRGVYKKSYDSREQIEKMQAARARREAKAAEKAAAEAAVLAAAQAEWAAANPALAARLAEVFTEVYATFDRMDERAYEALTAGEKRYGQFVLDMANLANYKGLTEAQTAAVVDALAKADARAEAAAERKAAERTYGEIGEKVVVEGTATVAMVVDGYAYGSKDMMLVITGTGDFVGCTFKITGSGKTLWDVNRGDSVKVTATVKKFAEYNGTPQTVLTRAKVEVLAAAPTTV